MDFQDGRTVREGEYLTLTTQVYPGRHAWIIYQDGPPADGYSQQLVVFTTFPFINAHHYCANALILDYIDLPWHLQQHPCLPPGRQEIRLSKFGILRPGRIASGAIPLQGWASLLCARYHVPRREFPIATY